MDSQIQNYQHMLLEHMRVLPTYLPQEIVKATITGQIVLHGGDFSLKRRLTTDLISERMYNDNYNKREVIILSTPSVRLHMILKMVKKLQIIWINIKLETETLF